MVVIANNWKLMQESLVSYRSLSVTTFPFMYTCSHISHLSVHTTVGKIYTLLHAIALITQLITIQQTMAEAL